MIRAGVPEKVAMTISGHKTRSIFDRYNIVNEEDLKRASEKVVELHQEAAARIERKKTGTISGTVEIFESEREKSEEAKPLKSGAADRNRTGTPVAQRGILSPLRLPIPPQRHETFVRIE